MYGLFSGNCLFSDLLTQPIKVPFSVENFNILLLLQLVIIDLAPNFSGSMMSISNFFANIISIIAPLVCGAIVQEEVSIAILIND